MLSAYSKRGEICSGWCHLIYIIKVSLVNPFPNQEKAICSGSKLSSSSRPKAGSTFIKKFELFKSVETLKLSPGYLIFSLNFMVKSPF